MFELPVWTFFAGAVAATVAAAAASERGLIMRRRTEGDAEAYGPFLFGLWFPSADLGSAGDVKSVREFAARL